VVKSVEHAMVEHRAATGKVAPAALPRERQAEWTPSQRTLEPLDLLAEQAETRLPDLVPICYGRMAVSPFAYYWGGSADGGRSGDHGPLGPDGAAVW
jgi:hypothetical protein